MDNISTGVLLVRCPDQTGIMATTTTFFAENNINIVDSEQHTDQQTGTFFQRLVFQSSTLFSQKHFTAAFQPVAEQMNASFSFHSLTEKPRVALLASKESHCLVGVLHRWSIGELNMEPVVVISDHLNGADAASWFKLPFVHLPVTGEKNVQENELRDVLQQNNIDLVVLARYMRILSGEFCDDYRQRCINVHHSFLPAFVGAKPYQQAFDRGVKIIGATSHYVTEDLDQGPIIAQRTSHVTHKDVAEDFVRKGRDLETGALVDALHAHLEHRVIAHNGRTIVFP